MLLGDKQHLLGIHALQQAFDQYGYE